MPKVIKSAGRNIILQVKRACEDERRHNMPIVPFAKVRARVAYLTGVSERTVTQITKEGNNAAASSKKIVTPGKRRKRRKNIDLDDFEMLKCTIRHIIQSFYIEKKEIPTVNKLWLEIKNKTDLKYSKTSLRGILRTMGYKYKQCQSGRKVLIERTDISAWRARYISRLRKNRQEKRPVIYLDETYIHAPYHLQKCGQSEEQFGVLPSNSVGARWIIAHAGGKTGFIENGLLLFKSKSKCSDYHDDIDSTSFMRWMREDIVPNLPSKCIVVMDNAPYHCAQVNKAPTLGSTKTELKEWLTKNKVSFENCWIKSQLFELVKHHKHDPRYAVEEMLNEHGHELLRLPPHHCELNPIEKIWTIVKRHIAEENVTKAPNDINVITETAFKTITKKEWINVCQHVEKIEDKYFESDRLLDVEMDKLLTNISDDTSDSSEEDFATMSSDENDSDSYNFLQDHSYIIIEDK